MVRSIHTGGTLRPLLAAAIGGVLLFVPAAFATVSRSPVRVHLAGPPRAAEAGKPFEAVLEIEAAADVDLEAVFLNTGRSWRLSGQALPGSLHLAKGETRRIPFTVTTDDPTEPLYIEYQVGEKTVRKTVDLSPAAIAARKPGALVRVEDPAGVQSLAPEVGPEALLPEPAPPLEHPDHRDAVFGRPESSKDRSAVAVEQDVRVVGFIRYVRMDGGNAVGVDGATARVYDEDSTWDELLATQVIGPDGRLDVTFHWDPCFGCDGTPDLYVEFELANSRVEVQEDGIFEANYDWQTGVWNDYGGTYLDIGDQMPPSPNLMPACHIMVNMMRAWRFALSTGRDAPIVDVQWPDDDDCPSGCYNDGFEEIHIPTSRQWDENTLVHEWGHHFVNTFSEIQEPSYCNGFCDTNQCGHCLWCRETFSDAFNEGFPNYYADVVISKYPLTYGRGPVTPLTNFETSARCGADNMLHDVFATEGAFTALLHDIDDAAVDDDTLRAQGQDELSLGFDENFWLIDTWPISSPNSFIARFKTEYPNLKEQFWATAANCGYQTDFYPPALVTNLTSDHTLNQNWDTRAMIRWSWNRALDDMSGIKGYSIVVQRDGPFVAPDFTKDIDDVTQLTTGPHTPGWYYISIRTLDRNDTWSDAYEIAGPFGIRAADPANLKIKIHSNWDYLGITARHVPDATPSLTYAPSYLDGAGGATYLSAIYNNSGEAATNSQTGQYWTTLFFDGMASAFHHRITPLQPGEYEYVLNKPVTIPGGRHVVTVVADETGLLSEPDELDNYWARQWAWVPPYLAVAPPTFMGSPPARYANTEWIVDGSAYYENCRGFKVADPFFGYPNTMWMAMTLHAPDNADYDLFAYSNQTSPTAGFATPFTYSVRGSYGTDVILMSGYSVGNWGSSYDFGVTNYSGGNGGFYIQKSVSATLAYPSVTGVSLAANEMLRLYQFDTSDGRLFARVKVHDPALGRVYLSLVHWTFSVGPLLSAGTLAVSDPVTGEAVIELATDANFYGLVVWRDAGMGTGPLDVTVTVQPTPSDPMVAMPPGWAAPLVPRPANDGAPGAVPAPAFLVGDAAQTWFNYALSNNSPVAVPPNPVLTASLYVDGVLRVSDSPPAPGANATVTRNLATAQSIPGGRHTFGLHIDSGDQVGEMTDANNTTAGQWVWQPATKPFEATQHVLWPPDRFAGWNLMPPGTPLWFNMDGLRSPTTGPDVSGNGWKVAFLSLPDAGRDFDLQLFEAATTATGGFDNALVSSAWGIDQVDFVLADYRVTTPRAFDVGFVAPTVQPGTGLIQLKRSKSLGVGPAAPGVAGLATRAGSPGAGLEPRSTQTAGTHGPFTIAAGDLFELFEVDLPPGNYDVRVVPGTGTIDWGISLHAPGAAFQARSDALPGGTAWEAPAGQAELLEVTIPQSGPYGVLVWKNQVAQVYTSGSFSLQFIRQTTGVPAEPASVASRLIAGVRPNPFVQGTRVEMRLAVAAPVSLAVFDLVGRRVMEQDLGTLDPGTHEVEWNGQDDQGRPASAGIYFVRVTAGALRDERKVVRVP